MNKQLILTILLHLLFQVASAGPIAAGICYSGCNALWVACCLAGGGVAGVTTGGIGVAPAIMACNAAQGVCMSSCIVALLLPTP